MERSNPDGIVEGPRLDELRARHTDFVAMMLAFGRDKEATRSELAAVYADWRGMVRDSRGALHYSSNDIHNLFALIRSIPGVAEDAAGRKFSGVGVDESVAEELRRGRDEGEDDAASGSELTLEELTQAAYVRLLALVESGSPPEAFEAVRLIIRFVELKGTALQQLAELEAMLEDASPGEDDAGRVRIVRGPAALGAARGIAAAPIARCALAAVSCVPDGLLEGPGGSLHYRS